MYCIVVIISFILTALPGGGKSINKLYFAYAVDKCGAGAVKDSQILHCILYKGVSFRIFTEVAVCRIHR